MVGVSCGQARVDRTLSLAQRRVGMGSGAGEGIRTLDHLLGRQVLYQPELLPLDSTHSNLKTMCRQRRVSLWRANAGR